MKPDESNRRHLAVAGIRRYLELGVPGELLVPGPPDAYLVVESTARTVAVHVAAGGPVPDLSRYENLRADSIFWKRRHWLRLSVSSAFKFEDLYPLLCLVLDGIQLNGQSFAASVIDALAAYEEVLTRRRSMSEADQIGLLGELLVVEGLMRRIGPAPTLASWLGSVAEEHDFSLDQIDVEVKTTSKERRSHWISSLSQLEPKLSRALYLLSLQITRAGSGPGRSLVDLVGAVRALAPNSRSSLDPLIEARGFRDGDADLYPTRWVLRTQPIFYLVDESFPAITSTSLPRAVPRPDLVTALNYQLDLTDYPPSVAPPGLLGLLDSEEHDR